MLFFNYVARFSQLVTHSCLSFIFVSIKKFFLPTMVIQVTLVALLPVSFRIGSTMAKQRSADNAVNVKTETPIERSLINSENLQTTTPYGHDSTVYTVDVNGTQKKTTRISPKAKEQMYLPPTEVQIDLINIR